jgi:hypothetical protein
MDETMGAGVVFLGSDEWLFNFHTVTRGEVTPICGH